MTSTDQPAIIARHNPLAEELIYRLLVQWPLWSQFSPRVVEDRRPATEPGSGASDLLPEPSIVVGWLCGHAAASRGLSAFVRRLPDDG